MTGGDRGTRETAAFASSSNGHDQSLAGYDPHHCKIASATKLSLVSARDPLGWRVRGRRK